MAWLLFNEWNWIADNEYLSRKWEAFDMNNIDVSIPRRIKPTNAFGYSLTETYGSSDTLYYATETAVWVVQSYWSATYVNTVNTTAYCPWAYEHVSTGNISTGSSWHKDTNPDQIRHFFIWASNIYVVNALWTALETAAISIASQTTQGTSRAICNLYDDVILYARKNKVYSIDATAYTVNNTATWQVFLMPSWASIKYLYFFNNLITVVYVINNDTYFQSVSKSWSTYALSWYTTIVKWFKCIDAVWDNGLIYWISTEWIHIYSGQSQFVKRLQSSYSFSTSARVSYNKWYLNIADWLVFWKYWHKYPWYTDCLSKQDIDRLSYGVTENYAIVFQSWVNKWYLNQTSDVFVLNNTWTSPTYMANEFWTTKEWLWIRIWHRFPLTTYSNATTQASVVVSIQTDAINAANTSTFVTLVTVNDHSKAYTVINPSTISKALETAWYTSNFNWLKVKINITWGDSVTANWNTYYLKAPEVFDFMISHNEILTSF